MKVGASTILGEVYSANDLEGIHPPAWEEGVNFLSSSARKILLILSE